MPSPYPLHSLLIKLIAFINLGYAHSQSLVESIMDRKFVMMGLGYAVLGLLLGVYMGMSHNHGQLVTHAHIMLAGFVVSFVYGTCHKLWLVAVPNKLAWSQFLLHQVGALIMVVCLFLLFGNFVSEEILGPILGVSSLLVLAGMILMKFMFVKFSAKS
jgi:hypothetical protein